MKLIDLNKNVYDLANENCEFVETMKDLGFEQIANPDVLDIAGKKITIPMACKIKRININQVIETFESKGFDVINKPIEENKKTEL